jgi:signal transduction histidine kinase
MNMRSLPIRIRLTVLYSIMFATVALMLSLTSWWMLQRTIGAGVRQDLQERADDISKQLHEFALHPADATLQQRFDDIYRLRDDGKWLQVFDEDGHWVYRSARMTELNVPLALPQILSRHGTISEFGQGTHQIRTFSSAIQVDGHAYSVEAGASINKQLILFYKFGIGLWFITPLVLFVAILVGHAMSRKALDPITSMAIEARRISDKNLDQRLPVPPTRDEIAHLSVTLNNMLARIDAGFRGMREFTANASHELRTPLARLRTEVDIALMRPRSAAEYQNTLAHIQCIADEMTGLTEALLSLARAETRSEPLAFAPVDAWELIQTVYQEWVTAAQQLMLDLRMERVVTEDAQVSGPLWIAGDRPALLRLLRILLDNACKFTPAGGAISVIAIQSKDKVLLAVEDTGIGIPEDQHERIFERFYRVGGDMATQRSGSGLGLSLAAWIAEEHNTTIKLRSASGAGSRFELSLKRIHNERIGLPVNGKQTQQTHEIISRRR